jgi:hypothetical protein
MLSLRYRDQLPVSVANELDSLVGQSNIFDQQHNDDGSHRDVVADSVSLQGARAGEITSLAYDVARYSTSGGGTWTVASADQAYLRYSRLGQIVFLQFYLQQTEISVDTPDYLVINVPELHALPTRQASGFPASQVGGTCEYSDIANSRAGLGTVAALAENFSGSVPTTSIYLARFSETDDGAIVDTYLPVQRQWPISSDFWIFGSLWFMCEPDNIPTPFFGS